MPNACDEHEQVSQNLIDAGCDKVLIEQSISLFNEKNCVSLRNTLSNHRTLLLKEFHNCQKKIECLDYLLYQFKDK